MPSPVVLVPDAVARAEPAREHGDGPIEALRKTLRELTRLCQVGPRLPHLPWALATSTNRAEHVAIAATRTARSTKDVA